MTPSTASGVERHRTDDIIGGKYRLLRKAGEGAMGAVWVAENIALGAQVAIKLLRPDMRIPVVVQRMLREARAAAKISHVAIVRIFDLGETTPDDPYIVMELLEGESLAARIDRERQIAPDLAVAMALPIAWGMNAAHTRGIVHRDLKPENIMLAVNDNGKVQPKVVDFGIVKLESTQGDATCQTGALLLGTPEYMSPEQAAGAASVDARSDVWSLGVVLYEMLAGAPPFRSANTWDLLGMIVRDAAPSLVDKNGVDEALWAIVDRALSKVPSARFQTMKELAEALEAWQATRSGTVYEVASVRSTAPPALEAHPIGEWTSTGAPRDVTIGAFESARNSTLEAARRRPGRAVAVALAVVATCLLVAWGGGDLPARVGRLAPRSQLLASRVAADATRSALRAASLVPKPAPIADAAAAAPAEEASPNLVPTPIAARIRTSQLYVRGNLGRTAQRRADPSDVYAAPSEAAPAEAHTAEAPAPAAKVVDVGVRADTPRAEPTGL